MIRHQKDFHKKQEESLYGTDGRKLKDIKEQEDKILDDLTEKIMKMKEQGVGDIVDLENMKEGEEEELAGDEIVNPDDPFSLLDGEGFEGLTMDDFDEEEEGDSKEEEDDDIIPENFMTFADEAPEKEEKLYDTSFCSFVHGMPGSKSRGEKFTYLVVQKRISGANTEEQIDTSHNPFHDVDVVNLLSESFQTGKGVRAYQKKKEKKTMVDKERHEEIIKDALNVEDQFLDSDLDPLGLELVRGDAHRHNWGRIVRAPKKKKGHVIVDFCTSQTVSEDGEEKDEGRIVRHLISRKESARAAPGMYGAARKARWGGLWPDVTHKTEA